MSETVTPATVVQLLQEMVRIDSVNSADSGRPRAEDQLRDRLDEVARAWGFQTRRLSVSGQADQLLITHEVDPASPWWLFDSHLDTVSVDGMTIDPFGGTIDGDRILGRGTCDTKGTGAAMLWAMHEYANSPEQENNIALLFSVDEEVSMTGIQSFLANDFPGLSLRDNLMGVIVGEPTDFHPVVAHNGAVRWMIATHGKAAHSSVPHEGRSAISMMMKVVNAIESTYIPSLSASHELTGDAVCSINTIQGGTAHNIIPAHCEIQIDRRVVPGEDGGTVLPAIESLLKPLDLDFTQTIRVCYPPLETTFNGPLTDLVRDVLTQMRMPTMVVGAPFCTNAGFLAQAKLPTLVLGPGSPHPAHTKDEWVSISAIEKGVELYGRIMRGRVTGTKNG